MQVIARFAASRSARALLRAAASSVGRSTAVPKYISSGVCPPKAGWGIFVAACDNPPSVMLATSVESGVHAGNRLKELLAVHGGRGGGSAQMAQASLPSAEALNALLAAL